MNELKGFDYNSNSLSNIQKLNDPYQNHKRYYDYITSINRIVLFGKGNKEANQLFSSSQETYPIKYDDSQINSVNYKEKSSSINMVNYKRIIIDLQKEFDEDQELLSLLQPQKIKNQSDQKKTGIKALFELKQSKIDMIPEEDEDKLKHEQMILNSKDKDSNRKLYKNGNGFSNKCVNRKRQLDLFNNQDLNNANINNNNNNNNCIMNNNNCNNNNHQHYKQLSSVNDNHIKLNSVNKKKETGGLLSPPSKLDYNTCLITNDKNNESPSTSGITHDSIKKHSIIHLHYLIVNYNYKNNNIAPTDIKPIEYSFIPQKIDLIKTQNIPSSTYLPPKQTMRPLSNPHHSSNLNLRKQDKVTCSQNIQDVINDLLNKREFSSQNDKKRAQLGSAPSQPNNANEKLFKYSYKNKEYFSNSNININNNNSRPMHKIKIERGLVSSKLIERFSKQLSSDYANDFNKNKKNLRKNIGNSDNEPIKIIKM